MMEKKNREELLQQVPEPKRTEKRNTSFHGAVLCAAGILWSGGAFVILGKMVWSETPVDKWAFAVTALLFLGGLVLVFAGSNQISRELNKAFWKDVRATLGAWRKKE